MADKKTLFKGGFKAMYRLRDLTLFFVCGGLLLGLGVWIGQSTNPLIAHAQSTPPAGDYTLFSSPYGTQSWYALKYNPRTGDVWVLDAERGSEDDEWLLLPEVDKTKK